MSQRNLLLFFVAISLIVFIWYRAHKRASAEPVIPQTLIVGTNAEFSPFTFIDNNNNIVGFDVDVIKEIAKRIGKDVTFKNMSFDALIPEIQLGNTHLVAAGMTPTEERAKRVFFTKPHLAEDPLMIVSLKTNPLVTVDQLAGKRVLVNEGYTSDFYISNVANVRVTRISSPSVKEGLTALKEGADAYISAGNALKAYFDIHGREEYSLAEIPETEESSSIAVSKRFPKLFEKINETVQTLIDEGIIQQLKDKWNIK